MELNTVVISIKEFDELREFKKNILAGKELIMEQINPYYRKCYFYPQSEAISVYEDRFKKFKDKIQEVSQLKDNMQKQVWERDSQIKQLQREIEKKADDIRKLNYEVFKSYIEITKLKCEKYEIQRDKKSFWKLFKK